MIKLVQLKEINTILFGVIVLILFSSSNTPNLLEVEGANAMSLDGVRLYFNPQIQDITKTNDLDLILDSEAMGIAFVETEIVYDPTKVVLVEEVSVNNQFTNIFHLTSRSESNATGRISISAGLSVNYRDNPPHGRFVFANLIFGPASSSVRNSTTIAFDQQSVQIVDISTTELPFTTESALMVWFDHIYLPFVKR